MKHHLYQYFNYKYVIRVKIICRVTNKQKTLSLLIGLELVAEEGLEPPTQGL